MADSPEKGGSSQGPVSTEEIYRRLVIEIASRSEGGEAATATMRKLREEFDRANKSMGKQSKSNQELQKQLKGIGDQQDKVRDKLEKFNKSKSETINKIQTMFKYSKKLGMALRGLGISAAVLVGVFRGLADIVHKSIQVIKEVGDTLIQFNQATAGGQQGVQNLISSYKELHTSGQLVTASLKEISEQIAAFGSQSFVTFRMSANKEMQGVIADVTNQLESVGANTDILPDFFAQLREKGGYRAVEQFRESMQNAAGDARAMSDVVADTAVATGAAGIKLQQALRLRWEVDTGQADDATRVAVEWLQLTRSLQEQINRLKLVFAEAFGPILADSLQKLGSLIKDFIEKFKENKEAAVRLKVELVNLVVHSTKAFGKLGGIAAQVFGLMVKGLSYVSGLFRTNSKDMKEFADSLIIFGKRVSGASGEIEPLDLGEEMGKLKEGAAAAQDLADNMNKANNPASQAFTEQKKQLLDTVERSRDLVTGMQTTASTSAEAAEAVKLIGSQAQFAGENFQSVFQESFMSSMQRMNEAMAENAAGLRMAEQLLEQSRRDGDKDEAREIEAQRSELMRQKADLMKSSKTLMESQLEPLETEKQLRQKTVDLIGKQKQMLEAITGTPGMAVEAIRKQNIALQEQKEMVQAQLAVLDQYENSQREIAKEKIRQIKLDKNLTAAEKAVKIADTESSVASRLVFLDQKRVDLQKEQADIQVEQLQNLKELKDGYLDAVQALAFGAGKFEKIIVTQEKNLGRGMDAGLIRQNVRLGAVGDRAMQSNVTPYRWSAQFGQMTDMQGMNLSPEDMYKQQAEISKNIVDPVARRMSDTVAGQFMESRKVSEETNDILNNMNDNISDVMMQFSGRNQSQFDKDLSGEFRRAGHMGTGTSALDVAAGDMMGGGHGQSIFTAGSGDPYGGMRSGPMGQPAAFPQYPGFPGNPLLPPPTMSPGQPAGSQAPNASSPSLPSLPPNAAKTVYEEMDAKVDSGTKWTLGAIAAMALGKGPVKKGLKGGLKGGLKAAKWGGRGLMKGLTTPITKGAVAGAGKAALTVGAKVVGLVALVDAVDALVTGDEKLVTSMIALKQSNEAVQKTQAMGQNIEENANKNLEKLNADLNKINALPEEERKKHKVEKLNLELAQIEQKREKLRGQIVAAPYDPTGGQESKGVVKKLGAFWARKFGGAGDKEDTAAVEAKRKQREQLMNDYKAKEQEIKDQINKLQSQPVQGPSSSFTQNNTEEPRSSSGQGGANSGQRGAATQNKNSKASSDGLGAKGEKLAKLLSGISTSSAEAAKVARELGKETSEVVTSLASGDGQSRGFPKHSRTLHYS